MHKHGGDIYSHPNFIDFSANINLLGAPPQVIQRAKAAMEQITRYPQVGCDRLRQAIAELEQVKAEQIICGNGAAEIFFSLALGQKPKKALLFAPTFQEYEQALKSVDCEIVRAYLRAEDGFRISAGREWCMINEGERKLCDFPAKQKSREKLFLERIDSSLDMVFFCNPNNPTGVLTDRVFLEKLLKKSQQAEAVLVVDECFLDFVSLESDVFLEKKAADGSMCGNTAISCENPYTMKPFLEAYPNLVIVKAFTKIFGIPGLRLGYALCGNQAVLEKMRSVTQPWNVSVPAQEAGIAAAQERGFIVRTRQAVAEEKAYLLEQLGKLQTDRKNFFIQIYGHAANFIFFKSIPGLEKELERYGILIRNCSNFEGLEEGWYRIAVRTGEENEQLIRSLAEICKGHS